MKPAPTDPPEVQQALWGGFTGDVGWDIGANCGQSADEMLRRFTTVYAYEPAHECAPYLDKVDDPNYIWQPVAISGTDGTIDLIEIPDKIDSGQLVSDTAIGMEYDPRQPDAAARHVTCRSVDSLIRTADAAPPDFMKIDVEGHESLVLFGAKTTLAVIAPQILLEFHSRDLHRTCTDILDSYGYSTRTVRHPHYWPGSDLWFSHGWIRATRYPQRVETV